MVKYFVEGAEECTAYNYVNTCEGDNQVGCFIEGVVVGENVAGECEELMAQFDIKMQLLEDEFDAVYGPSAPPEFFDPAKPRRSSGRLP